MFPIVIDLVKIARYSVNLPNPPPSNSGNSAVSNAGWIYWICGVSTANSANLDKSTPAELSQFDPFVQNQQIQQNRQIIEKP